MLADGIEMGFSYTLILEPFFFCEYLKCSLYEGKCIRQVSVEQQVLEHLESLSTHSCDLSADFKPYQFTER